MKEYPGREECLKMLKEYGTPAHVVGHCNAVAGVATAVGKRLNDKGFNLNIGLIEAAGLTHDIARVRDKHWEVAAKYLRNIGYDKVADIVEVHMFYPEFSKAEETNETDLVCLGDRTVKEDKYVGVEDIIAKADRYSGNEKEEVVAKILKKKQQLIKYIDDLEKIMEISLDDLMRQYKE